MTRLSYALPADALRRFDPTIDASDLGEDGVLIGEPGVDGRETVVSRIEGVEDDWDRTATPMRPVRVGSRDAPVYAGARGKGWPVDVYLDHSNVLPVDPDAGDFVERRGGRDEWRDITAREDTAWTADYRKGVLQVYSLPGANSLPSLRRYKDRFVRMSYRVGAGGEQARAGRTTLTASVGTSADTTIGVENANRLPPSGGTMLLGGEEYVSVEAGDGEATLVSRGLRRTEAATHDTGAEIHFCPLNVREAVAAKAARELVIYDDFVDKIRAGGSEIDPQKKIDEWQREWEETVQKYGDY